MGYFWDDQNRVLSPRFLYKYEKGWDNRGFVSSYSESFLIDVGESME